MPISRSRKLPSILASLTASVGLFWCGYGAGYSSPVLPMLQEGTSSIVLTHSEGMWFGALNSLGYLVAIPFGLQLLERLGRKQAMLANMALSALSWLLVALAPGVWALLAGRLLQGVASGLVYQTVPTYVSEIASSSVKGALVSVMGFIYLLGRICVLSICYVISWRMMALFAAVLSLVNFIVMLFMPESPRWLLKRGRHEDGKNALKWLRGDNNRLQRELKYVTEETEKAAEAKKSSMAQTAKDPCFYKPIILIILVQSVAVMSCAGPMFTFTETILDDSGFPFARLGVVIIAVVQFIVCVPTNLSVDKMGRKLLLSISAFGTSLSLFLYSAHIYASNHGIYPMTHVHSAINSTHAESTDVTSSEVLKTPYDWIPFGLLCMYFIFYSVGALNVNFLVCSELASPDYAGVAAGCAVLVCYGETFLSTLTFLALQNLFGPSGIYLAYAAVQIACVVTFMLVVPETSGDPAVVQLIWKREVDFPFCNWTTIEVEGESRTPLLSYSESVMPVANQMVSGSYQQSFEPPPQQQNWVRPNQPFPARMPQNQDQSRRLASKGNFI